MKYLLMCCTEEKKLAGLSRHECDALMDETSAYCEALSKSGHLIMAQALEPVQAAITVRVRDKKSVHDRRSVCRNKKSSLAGSFSSMPEISTRPSRWPRDFHRYVSSAMEVHSLRELSRL